MASPDAPEPVKYAVQCGALTGIIYIGRLDKSRAHFRDKEVGTDMVLAAVAEHVKQQYGGGMVVTFPGLGIEMEVDVRPLGKGDGG